MIRGVPIFSVSDGGDEHTMVAADGIDDDEEDNLYDADEVSRLIPDANATALNPARYSQLHTLAQVAADHEAVSCNRLIPNGTADHTRLFRCTQYQEIWCRGFNSFAKQTTKN